MLRVNGSPAQKGRLFGAALAGERFGNALAEIGTRTASERRTRLRADGDGYRLDGRKFYCTGALYAQRVPTLAVDDEAASNWPSSRATAPGWKSSTTGPASVNAPPAAVRRCSTG